MAGHNWRQLNTLAEEYMGAHVRIMTQEVSTLHNKVFMIDMISEPIIIKNGVIVSLHP